MRDLPQLQALVVDDNQTSRQFLHELLQTWGLSVDSVSNAPDAIAALQQSVQETSTYPLLIVDAEMPETSGQMLVETIRMMDHVRDVPVILLVSGRYSEDAGQNDQYGIVAQLMKPVRHSELREAILCATHRSAGHVLSHPEVIGATIPAAALKVLIAEDGHSNQALLLGLLARAGHEAVVVENGEQAIQQWLGSDFDLILMDIQMPVMDGLEATRRIRELEKERGGHITIVAVTSRAAKGDRERGLSAGMDYYLTKPIRTTDLFTKIDTISGRIRRKASRNSESRADVVARSCESES